MEAFWVDELVNAHVLDNWEAHDEPVHLRTIRDREERQARCPQRGIACSGTKTAPDDY